MLRQNGELRPHNIWNWTIPAWRTTLSDGSSFTTCPNASACVKFCYARHGAYRWPQVHRAHLRNLERVLDDRDGWQAAMIDELSARRFRPKGEPRIVPGVDIADLDDWLQQWVEAGGSAIRIHDAGDFFDLDYLLRWAEIARTIDDALFYAYTKEVEMVRSVMESFPPNLRILFSTGGAQDHLIDPERDRHADVFENEAAIREAGYESQDLTDLLCVLLPTNKIGIPANNIPHVRKRLAGRRFSDTVPARLRMRGA